jgi:hypothetical protein
MVAMGAAGLKVTVRTENMNRTNNLVEKNTCLYERSTLFIIKIVLQKVGTILPGARRNPYHWSGEVAVQLPCGAQLQKLVRSGVDIAVHNGSQH